jgi:endonuclease III related protein
LQIMGFSAQGATEPSELLGRYFDSMLRNLGPQAWWPGRTRLEVILGAILTQNTSWQNAELALKNLRRAGLLALRPLRLTSLAEIEAVVRPSGFFRQKARTIWNFLRWLDSNCSGSLSSMFRRPGAKLRPELLGIKGLGPETVDAILLYAGKEPFFVADAYTRRILYRHGLLSRESNYSVTQQFLHTHLPADSNLYNEYHALLVEVGKRHCRRSVPQCQGCPLEGFLPDFQGRPFGPCQTKLRSQGSSLNQSY